MKIRSLWLVLMVICPILGMDEKSGDKHNGIPRAIQPHQPLFNGDMQQNQIAPNLSDQSQNRNTQSASRPMGPPSNNMQGNQAIPANDFVKKVTCLSNSLELVNCYFFPDKESGPQETGELNTVELSGSLRNGVVLLLKSRNRKHRYHVFSYELPGSKKFNDQTSDQYKFFHNMKELFSTDSAITVQSRKDFQSRTKENSLFLKLEEDDHRFGNCCCGSRVLRSGSDCLGNLKSKFQKDPLGTVWSMIKFLK